MLVSVPSLYSSHYGLRLIRIIEHSDIQYWQHIPRSTMLEWIEVWEYQSYLVRIRVYEVTNNYAVLNASARIIHEQPQRYHITPWKRCHRPPSNVVRMPKPDVRSF